jgi:hypothetical protein
MAASLDEETNRLEKLGMFLSAFAPKEGQEMTYGPTADDAGDQAEAIVVARDAAILDAFAAVGRIARASYPPPTPPPAPKPAATPKAKVESKVGWSAKVKAPR